MARISRISQDHFDHIGQTLDENDKIHKKQMKELRSEITQYKNEYVKKHGRPKRYDRSAGINGIAPDIDPQNED
jgi:hypothetical protein